MTPPSIPMVDLAARHARVAESVEQAVLRVLRSGSYVGGSVVGRFERAIGEQWGRAHAVGVNSGTDALVLALRALGVGPGDEVIVPALSFYATAEAALIVGARPVVVDVLPDRPLMDPEAARRAWTRRTRAVIPVHLFGMRCQPAHIGVPEIDDAAQAMGSTPSRGEGDMVAISFYPTKVLSAAGDAGMVLTDDARLAKRVRALANHGTDGKGGFRRIAGHVGQNSRLDTIQAAILLAHLPDLPARLARRRGIAAAYSRAFGGLVVPHDPGSNISVLCIRHPDRDRLARDLRTRGVDTRVYYARPLSAEPVVGGLPTPHADRFCAEALALPCRATMSDAEVDTVIQAVQDFA